MYYLTKNYYSQGRHQCFYDAVNKQYNQLYHQQNNKNRSLIS